MSALVEWRCSANIASTLTSPTQEQWYDFFLAELTTWTGNVNSRWQIASSSKAGNPYYITLKRKAAGNGRVIFIINTGSYTPRPTMNYPAASATANNMHIGFFPDGNLDTPAGFTGSGDFLGNDSSAVGFSGGANATSSVTTAYILKFVEHEDAFGFMFQNSASTPGTHQFAGLIFDDVSGTALQGATHYANSSYGAAVPLTSISSSMAGGVTIQSSAKKSITRSSNFSTQAGILRDVPGSKAYFLPVYASVYNEAGSAAAAYKLRQFAEGPEPVAGANYQELYITGPSLRAISLSANPAGGTSANLWLVNFLT